MSIIYGRNIRLRAIEAEDVKRFYEWVNDPEVTYGLSLYLPLSLREEQGWYDNILNRPQAERPFAIELKTDDGWKHIGNCGLFDIDWVTRSAELGIMIGDKSTWNQGHGTETMTLLLRHGFDTLNLNRLYLHVYADNPRAVRTYEKTGFVLEGTLREAKFKHGKYDNVHIMSVLRREWDTHKLESR